LDIRILYPKLILSHEKSAALIGQGQNTAHAQGAQKMFFEFRKRIYGYECDVYGHMNNANYLQLLEAARAEALIEMGMPIARMRELDLQIFVTGFALRYLKAVQLEDLVCVKTWSTGITRLRGHWCQEVYDSSGQLCFSAEMDAVFARDGKPQRLPAEVLEVFASRVESGN